MSDEHEANRLDKSRGKVAKAPAPPPAAELQRATAARGHRRRGFADRNRRNLSESIGIFGLIAALLVVVFLGGSWLALQSVRFIPTSVDVEIGNASARLLESSGQFCPNASGQRALAAFAAPLVEASGPSEFPFEIHLTQDETPNAFALPGGQMMVTQGLVKRVKDPQELAGVIAHEIQHIRLRHSMKALIRQLGTGATLALVFGGGANLINDVGATRLMELSYSRDAEREADREGALVLVQAGYNPRAFTDLLMRMQSEQSLSPPALLLTHPEPEERAQLLADLPVPTTANELADLSSIVCE